jgi:hypothetical protein
MAVALVAEPAAGRADAVLVWNTELLTLFQQTSGPLVNGPPEVAREMAIVDSAMFDAANAATGGQVEPIAYGGSAVSPASADAAALSAGYTALEGIFGNAIWAGNPTNSGFTIGSGSVAANNLAIGFGGNATVQAKVLNEIQTTYTADLATMGTASAVTTGVSLGVASGNANLAANGYCITATGQSGSGPCMASRAVTSGNPGKAVNSDYATDGSAVAILNGLRSNVPAGSGTTPGVYVPPSAAGGRPEMLPGWGSTPTSTGVAPIGGLTPTGIAQIASNTVPGPPPIISMAYISGLLQTECQGSSQPLASLPANVGSACAAAGYKQETAAQAAAALFWNDPGTTFTPPGHWLQIANTVMQSQNLNEVQEARLSALVGEAEEDAGIATWGVKYADNLWRPVTAITSCTATASWNAAFTACDPTWSSLIVTPPHPDYVAGHPAFSGAASKVLENYFGTDDVSFGSTSNSYCNGGGASSVRSTSGVAIVACTVPAGTNKYAYTGLATIYSFATDTGLSSTSGCTDGGGTLGTSGSLTTCRIGTTVYVYNPAVPGCNDIVNGGRNDSPLICPITEEFSSFSAASEGPDGAEYSRVAGGIHTPFSVQDAATLGSGVGEAIAAANNVPEPASLLPLVVSCAAIGLLRRYHATALADIRHPNLASHGSCRTTTNTKRRNG